MILVTGGTGILGTQLLFDLSLKNTPIRALFRSKSRIDRVKRFFLHFDPEGGQHRFDKIEWVLGNILDIPSLDEHMEGISDLYHCAALVSFHPGDFPQLMRINRKGTANVVNVALTKNIRKMCYVSSTAAIGGSSDEIITEETKWKNTPTTTGYSQSKYAAEKEVWRGIEEGLNAVMVNPCVILGAGNWNESSLTVFKTVKKGSSFYPSGANATVDARDVSEIMMRLMESDISAQRFLCIGSNQTFKTLIDSIAQELNAKRPTKKAPRWAVTLVRRVMGFISLFRSKRPAITKETVNSLFGRREYDASKIKKALDFEFKSLEETIRFSVKGRMD